MKLGEIKRVENTHVRLRSTFLEVKLCCVSCLAVAPACRLVDVFSEKGFCPSQLEYQALQHLGDEECDNKEVEDKEVLVHTCARTHTNGHTQSVRGSYGLDSVSTYCKQRGGDRLPVLVNIISVTRQTWHCQRLTVPRHNQH